VEKPSVEQHPDTAFPREQLRTDPLGGPGGLAHREAPDGSKHPTALRLDPEDGAAERSRGRLRSEDGHGYAGPRHAD
jgi:hypothetical protein